MIEPDDPLSPERLERIRASAQRLIACGNLPPESPYYKDAETALALLKEFGCGSKAPAPEAESTVEGRAAALAAADPDVKTMEWYAAALRAERERALEEVENLLQHRISALRDELRTWQYAGDVGGENRCSAKLDELMDRRDAIASLKASR